MKTTIEEHLKIIASPSRPNANDYIKQIFSDFVEMHGDRLFGDDASITTGITLLDETPVTVIGQNRGKNLEEQIKFNYSMGQPEGYRKALRAVRQAEKFGRPIVFFVDTTGAYPGREAENRGQSNAIAANLMELAYMKVPTISVVIGFGGSGGALALSVADRIVMLEFSTFGVISPKSCANILWKDTSREFEAAKFLRITPEELKKVGFADVVIEEDSYSFEEIASQVKQEINAFLLECKDIPTQELLEKRLRKYNDF